MLIQHRNLPMSWSDCTLFFHALPSVFGLLWDTEFLAETNGCKSKLGSPRIDSRVLLQTKVNNIETNQIDKQRWLPYVICPIVRWTYYNDDSRQKNNLNDQTLRALRATGSWFFSDPQIETLCEPSWISRNKNQPDEGDQAWPAQCTFGAWSDWSDPPKTSTNPLFQRANFPLEMFFWIHLPSNKEFTI